MRRLCAIQSRSGDGTNRAAAANRNACSNCQAHSNDDANIAPIRHTYRHSNLCADGHAQPGPNRQPGCDGLRRAAWHDQS